MTRRCALLLLVFILFACVPGRSEADSTVTRLADDLATATEPIETPPPASTPSPPAATPTAAPTAPPPAPTQSPPTPTVAPSPTATVLPAPRWSLLLQLLRDGQVIAEGATSHELASYEPEVGREPDRYALRVLVSDGLESTELPVNDPMPFALFHFIGIGYVHDLDGDWRDEAIVHDFTGGAHCCSNYYILASDASGITTLDAIALGNGGIQGIGDLDGDGTAEILAVDDRLLMFGEIPLALAPYLPLVLCLVGDRTLEDCTTRFPVVVEQSATHYEDMLSHPESDEIVRQAAAIGVYAHYARIGRAQEGLQRIASRCPQCLQFVEQHRAEIDERLREERPLRLTASP
ncbi:hypothetical protein NET02_01880 [Thermomicrobiaceae bacterium CFH 74404]|uniref:VCBS repeat-containing protein n=1 Tax=Thermalbibacter longus TaxID=2951981 RepID=A0AA41WEC2_9BACT|nr:hypothetical protein [Thermalbibacter longus]MCM8747891.1 hypothetical protein [Thermalbibacter longus]